MKTITRLLALLPFLWSVHASAVECVDAPLSDYLSLAGGCTIGNARFSDFRLYDSTNGGVNFTRPFDAIAVRRLTTGTGFEFVVNQLSNGDTPYDNLISYRVTGVSAGIVGLYSELLGSGPEGDASTSVIQNYCLGGVFNGLDFSACTGTSSPSFVILDYEENADPLYTSLGPFAPVAFATVVTDLDLDPVDGDTASLEGVVNQFVLADAVVVPEPNALLLLAGGLLAASVTRRSSRRCDRGEPSCPSSRPA